jgi:hypothetical protein
LKFHDFISDTSDWQDGDVELWLRCIGFELDEQLNADQHSLNSNNQAHNDDSTAAATPVTATAPPPSQTPEHGQEASGGAVVRGAGAGAGVGAGAARRGRSPMSKAKSHTHFNGLIHKPLSSSTTASTTTTTTKPSTINRSTDSAVSASHTTTREVSVGVVARAKASLSAIDRRTITRTSATTTAAAPVSNRVPSSSVRSLICDIDKRIAQEEKKDVHEHPKDQKDQEQCKRGDVPMTSSSDQATHVSHELASSESPEPQQQTEPLQQTESQQQTEPQQQRHQSPMASTTDTLPKQHDPPTASVQVNASRTRKLRGECIGSEFMDADVRRFNRVAHVLRAMGVQGLPDSEQRSSQASTSTSTHLRHRRKHSASKATHHHHHHHEDSRKDKEAPTLADANGLLLATVESASKQLSSSDESNSALHNSSNTSQTESNSAPSSTTSSRSTSPSSSSSSSSSKPTTNRLLQRHVALLIDHDLAFPARIHRRQKSRTKSKSSHSHSHSSNNNNKDGPAAGSNANHHRQSSAPITISVSESPPLNASGAPSVSALRISNLSLKNLTNQLLKLATPRSAAANNTPNEPVSPRSFNSMTPSALHSQSAPFSTSLQPPVSAPSSLACSPVGSFELPPTVNSLHESAATSSTKHKPLSVSASGAASSSSSSSTQSTKKSGNTSSAAARQALPKRKRGRGAQEVFNTMTATVASSTSNAHSTMHNLRNTMTGSTQRNAVSTNDKRRSLIRSVSDIQLK